MKVLMINKFLYPNGGSETYIFQLGEQLGQMGHEVQYFGMEHRGRIVGNRVQSYTRDMDFHTGKLEKLFYPFRIIYSTEARKRLRPVLRDFRPDVVHLNNFNFQLTPSVIYEIRKFSKETGKKIPIIYTAHDYQWVCPNHMLLVPETGRKCFDCRGGRFSRCTRNRCIHGSRIKSLLGSVEGYFYRALKTYRLADAIICPSEFLNRQLSTNPLLRDKTITLHNFVDAIPAADVPASEEGCGNGREKRGREDEGYVLYFGRYSEEKGIRTLLTACGRLPQIPFIFAGSGPLKEEVGGLPNVEDRGFLTQDRLRPLIAGARFTVFPSEWYENCPFSVMESQILGTPVLAAAIGGTPELVTDKVTGELFEPGDAAQLTQDLRRLWEEPDRCREYAANCRKARFDTVEEYCRKLLAVYDGCIPDKTKEDAG